MTFRRLARTALAAAALLPLAVPAAAQRVTSRTAPSCEAPRVCSPFTVRFDVLAPSAAPLVVETLRLTFAPDVDATFGSPGRDAVYTAFDDFGPFSGLATVSADGRTLLVDFLDTGDPTVPGLPFTIGAGGSGWLEAAMRRGPVRPEEVTFAVVARLDGGATWAATGRGIAVPSTTAPEPSALALLAAGGVALLGRGARRRREDRRSPVA